jgi:hypothetical protein
MIILVIDANSNIFYTLRSGTIYKMTQSGVLTVFAIQENL